MSKRGENIYKRKDKRWEGRYIKSRTSSGKPIFGYVYAKSYKEVKEKLKNAVAQIGDLSVTEKEIKDFSGYCDEWIELRRGSVKESTYVKYEGIMSGYIKPFLETVDQREISEVTVGQFCQSLIFERKLSVKTTRDILTILRSVLDYTRKRNGGKTPEIEIIYPREKQKEMRVMSIEEQELFVRYMYDDPDNIKNGILLALMTGMRIGELCALRCGDISLEERTLHVSKTMQRIRAIEKGEKSKTKIIIDDAKSEKSNRIIPLTDGALLLCKQLLVSEKDAFLLTGDRERFIEPRVLQYRLAKYTRHCGLEGVHFHALRHTFATRCVEVGFEIKTLSEILGHSNTSVTLNRYVHSSMELKRTNMDKLSAIGM